jgi:BON domain
MSRKHQRDEREDWRRQQNRQGQNRWSTGSHEDDYGWEGRNREGRNWRGDEEYGSRGHDDMNEGFRGRNMRWGSGRNRGMWEGGGQRWGNEGREFNRGYGEERGTGWQENRGWDRWNQGWQGGRGGGWEGDRWQGGYPNRGEGEYGMESRYGRGDWNRGDWNQGMMGGNWNHNAERRRYDQGDWNQGGWNQGMQGGRENWRDRSGMGMQGQHSGRGPRSFKRQDDRIEEDINEQLTRHSMIDATEIEVKVQNGEVTLHGHVDSREAKRMAEDVAESVFGVKEVSNQIKIKSRGEGSEETSGKQRDRKAS